MAKFVFQSGQAEILDTVSTSAGSDLALYAPQLYQKLVGATITADELVGLRNSAQAYCEGTLGANRPLQKYEVYEEIDISRRTGQINIIRWPVLSIIQIKGGTGTSYDYRRLPLNLQWRVLVENEDYELDLDYGNLTINKVFDQIQIAYVCGFDFGSSTDPEIKLIKSKVGELMTWLYSRNKFSIDRTPEITSVRVVSETSLDYGQIPAFRQSSIAEIIKPLQKYQIYSQPTVA